MSPEMWVDPLGLGFGLGLVWRLATREGWVDTSPATWVDPNCLISPSGQAGDPEDECWSSKIENEKAPPEDTTDVSRVIVSVANNTKAVD